MKQDNGLTRAVTITAMSLIPFLSAGCSLALAEEVSGERAGAPVESGAESARYEVSHPQMGVLFKIAFYAPSRSQAEAASAAAVARIDAVNAIFTNYSSESEAMRLCHSAPHAQPQPISDEMCLVLDMSQRMHAASGGVFDVTVGSITKLWRRARRRRQWPTPEQWREAAAPVGMQGVELSAVGSKKFARLTREGVRFDFGGVAKGYAADEAINVLKEHGIVRALVDASGDITVGEAPPGETGWKIAIRTDPRADEEVPEGRDARKPLALSLAHVAVATSGDATQFFIHQGVRYSHIVDPRTGRPVAGAATVTVIARTGAEADMLASAVSVLGCCEGKRLIEKTPGAAARIDTPLGEKRHAVTTRGFSRWID